MRTSPASLTRICLLAAALVAPAIAEADNINRYFSWDAGSGAETWDNSLSNWGTTTGSQSGSVWTNYDNAFFEGTGGLVNVAAGVRVNKIYFTANGYEIAGTIGEFGNPVANNLGADAGITALISANVTSTYDTGIRKWGAGTVNFSGTNTFSRIYASAGVLGITGGTTSVSGNFAEIRTGGELAVSGGTLNLANGLSVSSNSFQANDGATSTLRVSGGTLNVTGGNFLTGRSTNGSGLASRIIQTGGAISYTNGTGWMGFADGGGNTQLDLSGGTFSSVLKLNLGVRGNVTLNISGTSVVTAPSVDYFYDNSVTGSGKTSVINLNGGELRTGSIQNNASNNTANLVLNGGLLTATANATINSNLSSVSAGASGARFDTNGFTLTVDKMVSGAGSVSKQGTGTLVLASSGNTYAGSTTVSNGTLDVSGLLGSGSYAGAVAINGGTLKFSRSGSTQVLSGALTGTGALQKTGTGTLTLATGGSYSGAIAHDAGTLAINGALTASGSSLAVASGATLRGTGSYAGAVTAASGAILTAGDGTSGTLTLGSLAFSGTGTLNVGTLSGYAASTALAVSGNLSLGSGTITVNLPTAAVGAGAYRLLSFGNTLTDLGGLVLSSSNKPAFVAGGRTSEGVLRLNGNFIEFYVAGDSPFWTGAVDGAWDTTTANWKTINGKASTQYLPASEIVLFNDGYAGHGVANTAVTLAAEVTPASVEFNNSSTNYTLSGAGAIAGASTTLTKGGTGSVTIGMANTFQGGTSVNNGTLVLGNAAALGTGAVALNGGALDLGGQSVGNAIALAGGSLAGSGTVTGVISESGGSRSLTIGGAVVLAGANTYTGGTTVSAGGSLEISGSVTGNIANAGALAFNRSSAATYGGVISGTGTLAIRGAGKITLTGASTFSGATTVESGASLDIGDGSGSVSFGNTVIANDGTLRLLAGASGTASVGANGALTGAGAFAASGRKVHLYSDITQSGAVTLTQLGAGGNYQDAIELRKAGTTTITAGSITLSGDVGKDNGDGNTLVLDTSAANGTIDLDISLGRSGVMYIPAGFQANAGTGAINVTGTGMADTGWRNTPVSLTGGAISITSGVASNSTLTIANSGASEVSGALSGGLALTKQGSGTLTLSAVGSNTGAITVSAGTLAVTAATVTGNPVSALGSGANAITVAAGARLHFTGSSTRTAGYHTGAVTVNGGRITFDTLDNSLAATNTLTLDTAAGTIDGAGQWRLRDGANKLAVTAAASGSVVSVAQLTLTGANANHTVEVDDGAGAADLTISSALAGHFGGERLTKTGAGTLVLTGAATHTGGTTISAGTLQVGAGGTTGSLAGSVINNASLVFDRSDALTHAGAISGTGSLTKQGSGALTLSGANSFGGGVTLLGGSLIVGDLTALGTGTVTLSGGTLDLANFAVTNPITFAGGTLTGAGSLASAITVTGNVSSATLNNLPGTEVSLGAGATVDLSTLTKDVVLTGAANLTNLASFTGKLAVAGALDLSSVGNRPSGATIELRSGGTLDFGATAFSGTVAYKGGAIQGAFTGTVNVADANVALDDANLPGGTVAVGTGASVDVSSFTGNLRLTGSGAVSTGLSSFAGSLELASGAELNLTTADAPNATLTVASGGTLKGVGSVGDVTLASGGTLAPGNSPGTQTYGSLTLQAGSSIDFEVLNTGGGLYLPSAGSDYDTLAVTGLLDISGLSAGNQMTINVISLLDANTAGDLQDFDPAGTYAFDLISYGSISNYGGSISQYFNLDATGLTFQGVAIDPSMLSIFDSGTSIQLLYAPIPEPSTYGLVLGGLALAGAAVRRRKKNSK